MQIDCIEYVTHCSPLDIAQYTAALTYLIDLLGDCFTLWLNVSDDDPSLSQEVKQVLGTRFVSRVTHDLTV